MYCSLSDLMNQVSETVLIALTDDEGQVINEGIINASINTADSEINGYAQKQYTVPFNPIPDVIRKISVDISLYNLFSRRGFDKEKDAAIYDRYKAAIRFLENLAHGVVTIGAREPAPPIGAEIRSNKRIFTRNSMEEF